jgi:hypothetical protein
MPRVTDSEVKEIIDTTITTTPFIAAANLIVTANLADKNLGADLLKEIERWLAAHLVAIRDPRSSDLKMGTSSTKFQGQTGLGLDHTSYGQQVKILDYTGTLASTGLKRASIEVISEEDSDEYGDD